MESAETGVFMLINCSYGYRRADLVRHIRFTLDEPQTTSESRRIIISTVSDKRDVQTAAAPGHHLTQPAPSATRTAAGFQQLCCCSPPPSPSHPRLMPRAAAATLRSTFLRTLVVAAEMQPDVTAQVLHASVGLITAGVRTGEIASSRVLGQVSLQFGVGRERPCAHLPATGDWDNIVAG